MRGIARALVVLAFVPGSAFAQQPSVAVSAAAQIFTADQYRLAGQRRLEPDLGVSWHRPDFWKGALTLDVNVTRRDHGLAIGRALVSLDHVRAAGLTWSATAGDTGAPPFVPSFGFSNLHAPLVTFQGVALAGAGARSSFRLAGGRTTRTRNIYGTDFVDMDQVLYQADGSLRVHERVEVSARGSHVRNGDLGPYTAFVDRATEIGTGIRYKPSAAWQLVGDVSLGLFRRRGAPDDERAPSWLLGSSFSGTRGWLEVNLQRFSVARFAAGNYPYNDRQGVFASGEWKLASWTRLFGGIDVADTNLDPAAAAKALVSMPAGVQTRAYGGIRVRLANRSELSFRAEGGGRSIAPSRTLPGYETDTSLIGVNYHGATPRASIYARYERRTNVDATSAPISFRQHDASGQAFFRLRNGRELFASLFLTRRASRDGHGQTDWQAGGGLQLSAGYLRVRLEGNVGRTLDWMSGRSGKRETIVAGISGEIAKRTYVNADVMVVRAPLGLADSQPWSVRSMIRLTRTMPYGRAAGVGAPSAAGPTGSLHATVFTDWNGNGQQDPGDEPVAGIIVTAGRWASAASGPDGRLELTRVPVGEQAVAIDLSSVPADYDLPGEHPKPVLVERNRRASVSFGLLPVGTIAGVVRVDADGDGQLSDADSPIDGAVALLDDGARSELARDGRFRFENVRLGPHAVVLAGQSLPDGTQIVGAPEQQIEVTRDRPVVSIVFLVRLDERPEVRTAFPVRRIRVPKAPDDTRPSWHP